MFGWSLVLRQTLFLPLCSLLVEVYFQHNFLVRYHKQDPPVFLLKTMCIQRGPLLWKEAVSTQKLYRSFGQHENP